MARWSQRTACFAIQDKDFVKMSQEKTFTTHQLLFELQLCDRSLTNAYTQSSLPGALIPTRNLNKQSKEPATVFKHLSSKRNTLILTVLGYFISASLILPLQSRRKAYSEDSIGEKSSDSWEPSEVKKAICRKFPPPACHHPLHEARSPATPHCFVSCKWCGLGRKQNFINVQRGQHCTWRLDLLITSNQAPHCILAPSPIWTPQHMTFSLAPHLQRVERNNNTILVPSAKKQNPVPPIENHSHLSMKRAVIMMELLDSLTQKASFSPGLEDAITAIVFCVFCGCKAKLFHAMTLRRAFMQVYPSK